jgi:hypothetical protein
MERSKYRLQKANSQESVNKLMTQRLLLSSDSRPLPYNDIVRVINENEQFDIERQASNNYRLTITMNGIFSNSLFNSTGNGSWSTFNESQFRDRTYPPNGASVNDDEDFTFNESITYHLKERNGWFGYLNPKINAFDDHEFNYMEPGKDKFDFLVQGKENWDLSIMYPASKLYNKVVENGLKITSIKAVVVGGKEMIALGSPYFHNVSRGGKIKLFGTGNSGEYEVMRLGLDNGDLKENYLVIDENENELNLSTLRFKKIHKGVECDYYFRVFKKVKTLNGDDFTKSDFDVYNLAFSKNIYDDQVVQFTNKNDVSLSDLKDNLGRPVSELYLSIIKTPKYGFTSIKSGLYLNDVDGIGHYLDVPDIRRIHNGDSDPFPSSKPLNDNVLISDDEFIGDLVEYNPNLLLETVLSDIHHRFNTLNREEGGVLESTTRYSRGGRTSGSRTIRITNSEPAERNTTVVSGTRTARSSEIIGGFSDGEEEEYNWSPSLSRVRLVYSKDSEEACVARNEAYFYVDTEGFSTANNLSETNDGSIRAIAGYYSDLKVVRYWDGFKFTSSDVCSGSSSGCENMRAKYNNTGGGTMLGGYCNETANDIEGSRFYFSGGSYHEDSFSGGSNTSCSSISTSRIGEVVSEFQYGLTKITTSTGEEIRKISANHSYDGKSYTVYVKWTGTDTSYPSIEAPYMVCNESVVSRSDSTSETSSEAFTLGVRQEGYFYKPFHKVQVREFSDYIEYGDDTTVGIPDYATKTNDGYIWRDLMNIGFRPETDYPFTNGAHYIHKNIIFPVKRQDPFGVYGLRYEGDISDIAGLKLNQTNKIKRSGDSC